MYDTTPSPPAGGGSVELTDFAAATPAAGEKTRRYRLQKTAQRLLPGHRITVCCHHKQPGQHVVKVVYNPTTARGHYQGLMRCGNRWVCPVCSAARTEADRVDLEAAIDAARDRYLPVLVTYTARHNLSDSLNDLLTRFQGAYRQMKSWRSFKFIQSEWDWVGSVRSTEVMHSLANGWHPHYHELVFLKLDEVKKGWQPDFLAMSLQNALTPLWLDALQRAGLSAINGVGLDVRCGYGEVAAYVAKFGHLPPADDKGWSIDAELTKGPSAKKGRRGGRSPFQLLALYDQGDKWAGMLFQEYAAAMAGRAQLRWSKGLRDLLEMNDEPNENAPIDESEDDDQIMAELDHDQWQCVTRAGLRGEVLQVAATGNVQKLWDYLDHIPRMDTTRAFYGPDGRIPI